MALTPSTMLPLGTPAPTFCLPNPENVEVRLDDFSDSQGLVVMFISNHCPFVVHLKEALVAFTHDYAGRIPVVAIASNNLDTHPQDGPEFMRKDIEAFGYPFPYLFDADQTVAKSYRAACTPDFFLFDGQRRLVYRGQFDGSRPGNDVPITGHDLRSACDALLSGEVPSAAQTPSVGCNIKWIPGNEPDYF